jgi:hypothetical protein
MLWTNVEANVPEPIDPEDFAADLARLHLGLSELEGDQVRRIQCWSQTFEREPPGQMGRGGSKDVAAVEDQGHWLEEYLGRGDLDSPFHPFEPLPRQGQEPVVGPNQHVPGIRFQSHVLSVRPHTRIHHGQRHQLGPSELETLGQDEGSGLHVLGRHAVGEVDDPALRRNAIDHAVTDAHELVARSEVGQEDDRLGHCASLASDSIPRASPPMRVPGRDSLAAHRNLAGHGGP